jgi:hypothetical protein
MRWWFSKFCLSLLLRQSNAKFLLNSLKKLKFFKGLVAAFRNLPVTMKLAPGGRDYKNCSVNRP